MLLGCVHVPKSLELSSTPCGRLTSTTRSTSTCAPSCTKRGRDTLAHLLYPPNDVVRLNA